jgi:hypothetical protein
MFNSYNQTTTNFSKDSMDFVEIEPHLIKLSQTSVQSIKKKLGKTYGGKVVSPTHRPHFTPRFLYF